MLLLLILLAFTLRTWGLGGPEFWFDEALTANVSGLGWQGILAHLRSAPFEHPPLYFLSLYPWQKLVGTSEFAFRFYSVFWGVLTIPLLYGLVRRLANRDLALLSTLVAVISPFLVAYSQEARMYSLLPCLAVLALRVFFIALERPRQPVWWLAYLMLLAGGVATHYYFGWIWLATTIFLGLESLRGRRVSPWAIAAHGSAFLVAVVWFAVAPGLRESLVRVWQGEMAFSLAYKMGKVMPTLLLSELEGVTVPPISHFLTAMGWLLALLGVWWSRRARILSAPAWRLLILLLVVPLLGSFLVPYGVLGRHLGYVLASLSVFWALGLVALGRAGPAWLAIGLVGLLLLASYGLFEHYAAGNDRSFGQALAYIDRGARPGDVVILTQPDQRPLETYYNRRGWPVTYVPDTHDPLLPDDVEAALLPLAEAHERLWLGPIGAWTADPEHLVERWFATRAYEVERVWFPDSHSVSLFLSCDARLSTVDLPRYTWGGRIRLRALAASPLELPAGEALCLRFIWRAGLDLEDGYRLSLFLVDDQEQVWASRQSEPCAGWCSTGDWREGSVHADRHALSIPAGTPPGDYRLQVAWDPPAGGPRLEVEDGEQLVQQVTVAQVTVLPGPIPPTGQVALPNAQEVTFAGQLTLLGYAPATAELRPGESMRLETHWQAEGRPAADYTLAVELADEAGQVVHRWEFSPFTGTYPSSRWQPGEYVKGQHLLILPSGLGPATYRLRMGLVGTQGPLPLSGRVSAPAAKVDGNLVLAELRVLDRPRRFDLPSPEHTLEARIGHQASLIGYDLDRSQAHPGGQVGLTLYWQAAGPMALPFKVFAHLIDSHGVVVAQDDAQPGRGCCPANTWAEGEVIVDEHIISLGADLSPGMVRLVVGLYNEPTALRVPAYDAAGNRLPDDRVQIIEIEIAAAMDGSGGQEAVPTPRFRSENLLFLPLVAREQIR